MVQVFGVNMETDFGCTDHFLKLLIFYIKIFEYNIMFILKCSIKTLDNESSGIR